MPGSRTSSTESNMDSVTTLTDDVGLLSNKKRSSTTTVEWVLTLTCVSLIKFGDAIEVYLPGVITQYVSCDLNISHLNEGILATSIYLFLTLATPMGYLLSELAGRKTTLLVGMYFSILSTIFCSIVHNYYTLLASRCIIGFSVGLNSTICGIYFAELTPTKSLYTTGTVVQQLSSAAGAAVVGVMGYFFLEQLGWRIFILISSIPVFIPAIILLHCFLPEPNRSEDLGYVRKISALERLKNRIKIGTRDLQFLLVLKISILMFGDGYIGQGQIIFLPNLIRDYNKLDEGEGGRCNGISGYQYLILSAVATCNVFGRIISYFIVKNISYKKCVIVFSVVMMTTYGIMMGSQQLVLREVALGVVQVLIAIQIAYGFVLLSDIDLLGANAVNFSATIITSAYHFGYFVGNVIPAFSPIIASLISCFVMATIRLLTSFTLSHV